MTSLWERGVSNHRLRDCLLKRLFRCRSKKTLKLRVTGFCEGNSPVTVEFPTQRASNAENVSIWWRHHVLQITVSSLWSSDAVWRHRSWLTLVQVTAHFTYGVLWHSHEGNFTGNAQTWYEFELFFFPKLRLHSHLIFQSVKSELDLAKGKIILRLRMSRWYICGLVQNCGLAPNYLPSVGDISPWLTRGSLQTRHCGLGDHTSLSTTLTNVSNGKNVM